MENNNINQSVMPDATVEPVKSKKKYNVPAIVLGLVALVLAGVAIFFGIKYFEPKGDNTEYSKYKENNGGELIPEKELEESQRGEITVATMADDYEEVVDVMNRLTADIENIWGNNYENGLGLAYKPEGLNTFIPMKLDIIKQIKNSNTVEANINALKTKLEGAGFNLIGTLPNLGSARTPDEYGYVNSSSNIVCGVSENLSVDGAVNLSCAKTNWTWLTAAEKTLAQDLETAYREKTGEYPVMLKVKNNIRNSEYDQYQTLDVEVKGAMGLFYRTGPDAKWQFFTATQAPLGCNEYNTDDLKKAYSGSVCYNGSIESTVQL